MRVAHISDLHALHVRDVRFVDLLSHKRLAGGANVYLRRRHKHPVALFEALVEDLNRVGPDHVAVTGDLTNLSLPSEFARARQILDGLTLGPGGVTVIPGNHDVYTWAAQRARGFERAIGPFALSDGASEVSYPVVRRRGDLVVVGLSSARPSPVPFADGSLGAEQLALAEQALRAARGAFRMVLLHHPPVENRHAFLRGLRDRRRLQEVLERAGAEVVLHGHEHRDVRATLAGPGGDGIPVLGVGSSTYDDPRLERRARYNLLTISGLSFTVETRVHDPATGRFVVVPAAA